MSNAEASRTGEMNATDGVAERGPVEDGASGLLPEFDDVGEEYLAEAVVRLIRHNRAVRRAVLDLVMSCPNVKTEC